MAPVAGAALNPGGAVRNPGAASPPPPRVSSPFYLRALAAGDGGGTYVYGQPAGQGRDDLLDRLAQAWRAAGAHDEGAAWFRGQGRLDVWARSAAK